MAAVSHLAPLPSVGSLVSVRGRDWIVLPSADGDVLLLRPLTGGASPPFPWDEEMRVRPRCELDAALFHLYGIARADVACLMDTFPIVKRKDEAAHGEYRTKRVILGIYDALQRAMETGVGYEPATLPGHGTGVAAGGVP